MEQERIYLTPEQVTELWEENEDGTVHIQKNPQPGMLMGFDKDRDNLLFELKEAEAIEIGGENCIAMGHGIILFPKEAKYHSQLVFIQHNKEKLALFLKEKTGEEVVMHTSLVSKRASVYNVLVTNHNTLAI